MSEQSKPAFRNAKFEATGETEEWDGLTMHRIRAVADIAAIDVKAGDVGGWIEKENNLSVIGNAWVGGNAMVSGNAMIEGNARVSGDARVEGYAWVGGNARVSGAARIYKVNLTAVRSDNYTFTIAPTPEGPRVIAGCRYFSFEQAREHWIRTRGGTPLGEETMAILDLLEAQSRIHGFDKPFMDAPDGT